MPIILDGVDRAFTLHRAWEQPDSDAFIREVASDIRGLVPGLACPCRGRDLRQTAEPRNRLQHGRRLRHDRRQGGGSSRPHRYQYARRADGRGRRSRDRASARHRAPAAAGRSLPARRQVAEGSASPHRDAPRPEIGILGLGRIGKAIGKRLEAFGLEIGYHGRNKQDVPYHYKSSLVGLSTWGRRAALRRARRQGDRRHHQCGGAPCAGPEGILVNVGRGSVVDEPALVEALKAKTILSAGLDVVVDERAYRRS